MITSRFPLGDVSFSAEYFSTLVGEATKQCYGVAAMTPRDLTDVVKSVVRGNDYSEKGVRVTQEEGRLVIELHIAVSYLHHLVPQAAGYEPAVQLLHLECPLQRGLQPHCLQYVAGHLHRPHPRLRRPDRCEHQLYGLSYGPYPLDCIRHGCHPSGRTKSAPGRL